MVILLISLPHNLSITNIMILLVCQKGYVIVTFNNFPCFVAIIYPLIFKMLREQIHVPDNLPGP